MRWRVAKSPLPLTRPIMRWSGQDVAVVGQISILLVWLALMYWLLAVKPWMWSVNLQAWATGERHHFWGHTDRIKSSPGQRRSLPWYHSCLARVKLPCPEQSKKMSPCKLLGLIPDGGATGARLAIGSYIALCRPVIFLERLVLRIRKQERYARTSNEKKSASIKCYNLRVSTYQVKKMSWQTSLFLMTICTGIW